jgi:hypothetical protein
LVFGIIKPIGVPVVLPSKSLREIEHHLFFALGNDRGLSWFSRHFHLNGIKIYDIPGGQPSYHLAPLHVIHQSCYPKRVPKLFPAIILRFEQKYHFTSKVKVYTYI